MGVTCKTSLDCQSQKLQIVIKSLIIKQICIAKSIDHRIFNGWNNPVSKEVIGWGNVVLIHTKKLAYFLLQQLTKNTHRLRHEFELIAQHLPPYLFQLLTHIRFRIHDFAEKKA